MLATKEPTVPVRFERDPFALLRRMRAGFDRMFDDPFFAGIRVPLPDVQEPIAWVPDIEVLEKDNRYITRVDLPGLKKDEVKVEIINDQLIISGERKREKEETKDNVYRCEREYGRFYRAVPLPDGTKPEEVKATFGDGVLEVSVPIPAKAMPPKKTVEILDAKGVK